MKPFFTDPRYLWALFIIPFLIFFHFYSIRKARGNSIKFANFDAIARIKGIDLYSKNISIFILDVLIIISLILSLSGLSIYLDRTGSTFSFVIAIDSSESMGASDITPNRIGAAKDLAIDFVNSLPEETKIGVISFSENTFIEQELTSDKKLLSEKISKINITDNGGTDVYEAISISKYLLKDEENKGVILLSDGQINTGNIDSIINHARSDNIIIDSIGIGTTVGGTTSFGISRLDEDTLKTISANTSGKYFNINNRDEFKGAFDQIAPSVLRTVPYSLSLYLIIAAIVFFVLRQLLISLKKVSI